MWLRTAAMGAGVGFGGGIPFAALVLLCVAIIDPFHPPTLVEFFGFLFGVASFTMVVGALTAATVRCALDWSQGLGAWQWILELLQNQGRDLRSAEGMFYGVAAGAAIGAFLGLVVILALAVATGSFRAPLLPLWICASMLSAGLVCGFLGVPIGIIIARDVESRR